MRSYADSFLTTEQKKGTGPMEAPTKPKAVYRLRPVKILPGVYYYKITRQQGAEITLEVVSTDNEDIAKRLSRLRYPELCQFMDVLTHGLCEALSDEVRIRTDDSDVMRMTCVELFRAIVCLQRANAHFSILADLICGEMSPHELSVRPIADKGRP